VFELLTARDKCSRHEEWLMRRILIILEAATIGMVTAFGFLSLWHDWKMSHGPQAVVLQIHIPPMNPPKGWRI
jgi:hypothetical protein